MRNIGGFLGGLVRYVCYYLCGTFVIVIFIFVFHVVFDQKPSHSFSPSSDRSQPEILQQEISQGTGRRNGNGSSSDLRGLPHRMSKRSSTSNPLIVIPVPVPADALELIQTYHESEKNICMQTLINITDRRPSKTKDKVNWCPCLPPDLIGRVVVNMVDDSDWTEISRSVGSDVLMGGEWSPAGRCVPHTRLAIIFPCRDRDSHLRIQLRHLYPILKRQLTHFRIFIVDQKSPSVFNKAAIMNVAFLEAYKRFPFDCVVFHDVDLLLEDDRMLINCGPEPRHFVQALDKWGYGGYPTFGGVVSLTPAMFRKVDGYALRYFGWGGEDDDMGRRLNHFWWVKRPPWHLGRFSSIPHIEDEGNPRTGLRRGKNKISWEISDGLRNVTYDLHDVQLKPLFTRFHVDLNITFLPYPEVPAYTYQRVPGFCTDPEVVLSTKRVSMESCRSQCDIYHSPRCMGFSYLKKPHDDGGVGGSKFATNGQCTLLRNLCDLSKGKRVGMTYVKDIKT